MLLVRAILVHLREIILWNSL